MVLFNATGSQASPVRGVGFVGLGFRDAAASFFEPHGLPSGGDWALQRSAALIFEGAEAPLVAGCAFERMDGVSVLLSGFVRDANISLNSFAWSGETVVAAWGYGDGGPVPGMGPDLTAGNQPRRTTLAHNFAREIGVWQKQSSFFFSAVAGLANVVGNIAFNGSRAAINHNDWSTCPAPPQSLIRGTGFRTSTICSPAARRARASSSTSFRATSGSRTTSAWPRSTTTT
jgi:hypothetical protein